MFDVDDDFTVVVQPFPAGIYDIPKDVRHFTAMQGKKNQATVRLLNKGLPLGLISPL